MKTEIIITGDRKRAMTVAEIIRDAVRSGSAICCDIVFLPSRNDVVSILVHTGDSPVVVSSSPISADILIYTDGVNEDRRYAVKENGTVIVNAAYTGSAYGNNGRLVNIDAMRLSCDLLGQPDPAAALLGAFAAVSGLTRYEDLVDALRKRKPRQADEQVTLFAVAYASVLYGRSVYQPSFCRRSGSGREKEKGTMPHKVKSPGACNGGFFIASKGLTARGR